MRILLAISLILCVSCALGQNFSHGTALVILRTPYELVVAADSKEENTDGTANTNLVCKIRQFGRGFFAVHGMNQDSAAGFDVFRLIEKDVRTNGTLDQIFAQTIEVLRLPLEKAIKDIRNRSPSEFKKYFVGHDALGVLVFGVESGETVLCQAAFTASESPHQSLSITVQQHRCPGPVCPAGLVEFFVSPNKQAETDFLKTNRFDSAGDLVSRSRSFIMKQIDLNPQECGPPIDIVCLTKTGPVWVARKEECLLHGVR